MTMAVSSAHESSGCADRIGPQDHDEDAGQFLQRRGPGPGPARSPAARHGPQVGVRRAREDPPAGPAVGLVPRAPAREAHVKPRSWLRHYALSVAIVGVVIAIKSFVLPGWSLAHPYLSFYPAIILAGWYGGFRPGGLATPPGRGGRPHLGPPPLDSVRGRRGPQPTSTAP